MDQSGIHQPLQGILVFAGPCSFFDDLVDKLFIFPGQLGRYGLPDHRNLREFAEIGVFGKVTLIGAYDPGQGFLHSLHIPCLRPHLDGFRHTAGHIVHLQLFTQGIEEGIRNRLNGAYGFQIVCQIPISVGQQELCKGHRVNLHKVDFTYRERRRFC